MPNKIIKFIESEITDESLFAMDSVPNPVPIKNYSNKVKNLKDKYFGEENKTEDDFKNNEFNLKLKTAKKRKLIIDDEDEAHIG